MFEGARFGPWATICLPLVKDFSIVLLCLTFVSCPLKCPTLLFASHFVLIICACALLLSHFTLCLVFLPGYIMMLLLNYEHELSDKPCTWQ